MANIKRANTSGITKTGTVIPDVPDAPTIGTATNVGTSRAYNNGSATVSYTAAARGGPPKPTVGEWKFNEETCLWDPIESEV